MSLLFFFAVLVSAVCVSAADHLVTVGDGGMLAFNPTSVTAVQGDTVTFSFRAGNHSATQSTFAFPCTKSGIDSGFVPIANSTVFGQWTFTVDNSSTPLWFFCAQTGHCEKGMVFAVNPTQEKTFQAFLANAQGNGTAGVSASASGVASSASTSAGTAVSASSSTVNAAASSTVNAAASSTVNANTASNGAVPSLRIHRVILPVAALAFGILF
ncbi:Cupredoxin [Desarmillaria tabescens]|uniref:Cupredoxin n=1 Tax=Armillaria tabescens TaxID=1929756 RepID=A0AA39NDX1_ARMTA|nr:Cupredoxin [Desarmillaria tabescens]KAK0463861.1 Cupredoxin [Desarmillaria tabescens]